MKEVELKNKKSFRLFISRIINTLIDNAEDFDTVMLMYDLLEYSGNYSMASRRLWNYYRDKIDGVEDNASQGKWFEYKTKVTEKTPERPPRPPQLPTNPDGSQPLRPPMPALGVEVTIPFKYLGYFWRSPDILLINCEEELNLSWPKGCLLIEHHNSITGVNLMIKSN